MNVADGYSVFNSGDTDYPYLVAVTSVETIEGAFKVTAAGNNADGYSYANNVLTISTGGTYTIAMADGATKTDTDTIVINTDSKTIITLSNVNITSTGKSPITVSGSGAVTLTLDGDNTLTSTDDTGSGTLKIRGKGGLTAGGSSVISGDNVSITGGYYNDTAATLSETDGTGGTVHGVAIGGTCTVTSVTDNELYNVKVTQLEITETCGDLKVTSTADLDSDYTYSDNMLTISSDGEYTIEMVTSGATTSSDHIKVDASEGGEVIINLVGVGISSGSASPMEIDAAGDVTVTLSGTNILKSTASNYAGLQKTSTANTLTITSAEGDGSTEGTLTATGGTNSAGIGGGRFGDGHYITINDGTVTATGGAYSAGIGSGNDGGTGEYITITGGTVEAYGSTSAAGIGGSTQCGASHIATTGGYVTAKSTAGSNGAGIGDGENGSADDIAISGGHIIASGGSSAETIGAGSSRSSSNISITGGYFGSGNTSAGTVYSVTVADGYYVYDSGDETYPYLVDKSTVESTAGAFKVTSARNNTDGYSYENNVLTISNGGTYTIAMADGVGSTSTDTIVINTSDTTVITLSDVNISSSGTSPITVSGGGDVTLTLDGDNTLTSTAAAVNNAGSGALTITGDGGLVANGNTDAISGNNITISGGYFGDIDFTETAVYGCAVAAKYAAYANDDTKTSAVYPCVVTNAHALSIDSGSGYTYKDNVLTITEGGTYTIAMSSGFESTEIDSIKVTAADDVTITLDGVNITSTDKSPLEIDSGSAENTVTIVLKGTNTLTASSNNYAGLQKTSTSNYLVITSASGDYSTDGSLTASAVYGAAGIGGGYEAAGKNITITGGTITATGTRYGTGIGAGEYGNAKNITISGGTITATGIYGAGIGSGSYYGSASKIAITGGWIAAGSTYSNAIGDGYGGDAYSTSGFKDAVVIDSYAGTGTAYGNPALTDDASVAEDCTLTVESGHTITIPEGVTLTNNGTIYLDGVIDNSVGTLVNNGEIIGSGSLSKKLDTTLTLNSTIYYTNPVKLSAVLAGGSNGELSATWYSDNTPQK